MIALAYTIERKRNDYYAAFERNNKATDIRSWLEYFANTILEAPAAKFLLCMGLFSIFWFGQERAAPRGLVVAAFTRLSRAKAGGPGSRHMKLLFLRDFLVLSRC